MVRFLGSAALPGVNLKYYVYGSYREGFGIRISEGNGECANQYVSRKLSEVLNLACQLRRCSVFPENLCEILEDLQYGEVSAGAEPVLTRVETTLKEPAEPKEKIG